MFFNNLNLFNEVILQKDNGFILHMGVLYQLITIVHGFPSARGPGLG